MAEGQTTRTSKLAGVLTLTHSPSQAAKEKEWQFPINKQVEEILAAANPESKMMVVTCGNPLTQVPDAIVVKKGILKSKPLLNKMAGKLEP